MLAEQKIKEHPDNLIGDSRLKVLSLAAIYGRNASGKSNLIRAIKALQYMVADITKIQVNQPISFYEPYILETTTAKIPVEFKIEFIAKDNIKYDYEIIFDEKKIIKETLWFYPKKQIALLFERNAGKEIIYGDYFVGRKKDVESTLYENQLFLSKVLHNKIEILTAPFLFFSEGILLINIEHLKFEDGLVDMFATRIASLKDKKFNENISTLMRVADTGVDGFSIKLNDTGKLKMPEDMDEKTRQRMLDKYKYQIRTIHKLYKNGKPAGNIEFKIKDESAGTVKLLAVGGLILEALASGQTIIVDEMDNSLHPKLTLVLIGLFLNKKTNPKGAQLIFATHDTSLLNTELLRRDQIWIADNEEKKGSNYYSLSDIQGVRNNIPFDKWYLSGRFGGTPVINDSELVFKF